MPRTNFNEPITDDRGAVFGGVGYTPNNTIAELIDGLNDLIRQKGSLENNPSLKAALEYVFGVLGENIDNFNGDVEKIAQVLEAKAEKYKDIPVSELEDAIKKDTDLAKKAEEVELPHSDLNKMRLDELVEAYEKSKSLKDKVESAARIEELLARYKGDVSPEIANFIKRQNEILAELRMEMSSNLPKEKLWEMVVERMDGDDVEIFADDMAKRDGHNIQEQEEIRKIVLEEIRGGEIRKETGLNPTEIKQIKLETDKFIQEHKDKVEADRAKKIKEAFDLAAENAVTEAERRQVSDYGKEVAGFYQTPTPNLILEKTNAENELKDTMPSPGNREDTYNKVEVITKALYNSDLDGVIKRAKNFNFNKDLISGIEEGRAFEAMVDVANKNPEIVGWLKMAKAKVEMVKGVGNFVSKWIPGGKTLVGKATETIGGVAIKKFLVGGMQVIAEQGLAVGAKTIVQGIMLGSTTAAEAAGATTLVTTMAGLFAALPPVAVAILVVMAVVVVYKIAYKIYDTVAGWVKNITGSDLMWGVRNFFTGIFGDNWFGRAVGTVGQMAFNGMMTMGAIGAMLFGPILAAALGAMSVAVMPVIIGVVASSMILGYFSSGMVSQLVPPPPKAMGGTCRPKEPAGTPTIGVSTGGVINCDQNAPEAKIGISKEDYNKFANDWNLDVNTGKVIGDPQASECFNDVVNKAKCAGIVPEYALWAWLHESGASNYSRFPKVSDFGTLYDKNGKPVPKNDFTKQIEAFLELDPAQACLNDPRIANDPDKYWLSFSTNFLTGDCDPDEIGAGGVTGRAYLADLKKSWSRLGALPKSIHSGNKGGQNCNGNKNKPTPPMATSPNEYVDENGVLMLCDGPVDKNGNFIGTPGQSAYDPNAPGLVGEKVEGECSVASKVVQTNQCYESWSNKNLPGPPDPKWGLGTICEVGCGPSSVSSILRGKNGSMTPDSVIFESGSAYSHMNGAGSGLDQAQTTLNKYGFNTGGVGSCSQKDIANWICSGKGVIILAYSYTGSDGGYIGHILPVVAVSGGKLITKDPYYGNKTPFVTEGGIKEGQIKELRSCLPVQLGLD